MTQALPTGTVTMLFTDIEGSTRLLALLGEERYGQLLADHRRLLRDAFAAQGGREMDTQGDAFFYAFARARQAALAALDGQRALAAHEWAEGAECRVRMGLHTGEPSVGDEGYHGMGLHRGARIAHTARGGQILLSSTTADLIRDELPAGASLKDLGERRLKDFDRPERVYELVATGLPQRGVVRSRRRLAGLAAAGVVVAAAAAAAIVLTTRGGSSPATASAAAVSSDSMGIFRASGGRLAGTIGVGASPGATTTGAGSIWVANVDDHSVSRIDPVKRVVIQTFQVGNGPAGIAYGGGFVWVTNALDGTVTQIDPQTNTVVDTIDVGNGPAGIAVGGRDVWVANANDGTVSRIALATGKVHAAISIPGGANGVAVGSGSVWVTGESTGTVTRLDEGSGGAVTTIHAGNGADAVAVGAGAVWVANSLDGTVTRIDPATNQVAATVPVGDGPGGVVAAPGVVWVSNELAGTLSRIDPARNVVAGAVDTGNRPEGLSLASGSLFVAVRASGAGHRGGTLNVRETLVASSADPASGQDYQLSSLLYDGLTTFRKAGGIAGTRLVPDLAISLPEPTDGGLSYTFQLRPGIRYSSGALVEPQDIRRELERSFAVNPGEASYFAGVVGAPACLAHPKGPCDLGKGISVDDATRTITFHLTAPDPELLFQLALPYAAAVPADTPVHPRGFIPGTGPYELAAFRSGRLVRLVRNPHFREWSPAAQPDGLPDVIVERVGKPDANIAAVLGGAADLATGLTSPSPAVLDALRTRHAGQLEVNPSPATWFLFLNTRLPPFTSLAARQALSFAVDRRRLRDLTVPDGSVTCQILPPDIEGYHRYCPYTVAASASGVWTGPDLARARQLVRQSGTAGQKVTVWIPELVPFDAALGKYVVSVLDRLGYRASYRVGNDPWHHEDAWRVQLSPSGWLADFAATGGFVVGSLNCASYNRDNSENSNFAEFCDPAIDREIARAQSIETSDPAAATQLWTEVDRALTDEAPWVTFANGAVFQVKSPRLGNYQYSPQWRTLLDQLWVR